MSILLVINFMSNLTTVKIIHVPLLFLGLLLLMIFIFIIIFFYNLTEIFCLYINISVHKYVERICVCEYK